MVNNINDIIMNKIRSLPWESSGRDKSGNKFKTWKKMSHNS